MTKMFRLLLLICVSPFAIAQASAPSHSVGTVKAISGNAITVNTDAGTEAKVQVQDAARVRRISPGDKDLKNAANIRLSDIQAGDRVLVTGRMSDDGKILLASSIIVVKKAEVAQRQQQELQDWQKRGAGGLVKSVDPATGLIVISVSSLGSSKLLNIQASKDTVVRRYSGDSVKFDDAKLASLAEVKPGDQLRARGNRSSDGSNMTAEEIVSGTFRNISGLVTAIDPARNTVTINDLSTKKSVTIRIAPESQMHNLPAMMATRLAMRLKPNATDSTFDAAQTRPVRSTAPAREGDANVPPDGGVRRGRMSGGAGSGNGDIQQILSRLPAMQFSDFQKGDAIMAVTTEGSAMSDVTAINLLSGVEPILTASPNGNNASLLSPWSLATAGGDSGP